jgi:branched-chain amino acid transport system permease protein
MTTSSTPSANNPISPVRWRSALWPIAIVAVLIVLPHLIGWLTGDSPFGVNGRPVGQSVYWQGILIETLILAILAMSYNLLFGFTGIVSFGHALFFGIGGYVLGLSLNKFGFSDVTGLIVGIVAGLAVCAVIGLIIGLVSLRVSGVYFAMFTLAVAEMASIFFSRWSVTGAEDGFTITVPDWLNATGNRLTYYYLILILFIGTFLWVRRLIKAPFGAVLLAIRENEPRAQAIGYRTLTFKLMAMMFAGGLAGLAGILQVIYNKKVDPGSLGLDYTVNPLLMTIIGGMGTFSGPVIGAIALHLSDRLFRNASFTIGQTVIAIGSQWTLILGIAFIAVVMLFPQGIAGTWQHWRAKLARRQ